jgi:hypothetical protein
MYNKTVITQAVLREITTPTMDHGLPIDRVVFSWWRGGRNSTSLRLSDQGFQAFCTAGIAFYEFPLITDHTKISITNPSKFVLELGRKIKCPFYVMKSSEKKQLVIRIYDDQIAVIMTLYGSLQEYLESQGEKR